MSNAVNTESTKVWLSEIDEERFGFRSARATSVTADALEAVIGFCRSKDVQFLIARCPAGDLPAVHAMERSGFELMDTLVYYVRDLLSSPIPTYDGAVTVRPVRSDEVDSVGALARHVFSGFGGHYHADGRLDRSKCDDTYASWAVHSIRSRGPEVEVLVADLDGMLVGLYGVRLNSPEEGDGILGGVVKTARGRGVFRALMVGGMEWCVARGATRLLNSTQLTNLTTQRVFVRLGFEPHSAYYTFHKWF